MAKVEGVAKTVRVWLGFVHYIIPLFLILVCNFFDFYCAGVWQFVLRAMPEVGEWG